MRTSRWLVTVTAVAFVAAACEQADRTPPAARGDSAAAPSPGGARGDGSPSTANATACFQDAQSVLARAPGTPAPGPAELRGWILVESPAADSGAATLADSDGRSLAARWRRLGADSLLVLGQDDFVRIELRLRVAGDVAEGEARAHSDAALERGPDGRMRDFRREWAVSARRAPCDGAPRTVADSARVAFTTEVARMLLDTQVHELRGQLSIKVRNTDPNDPESPLRDLEVPHPPGAGPHTYLGVLHAELGALRAALGDATGRAGGGAPPIAVEGERVFVGRPPRTVLVLGHHHGDQLFVPVKLFARSQGAYVRVACPLANCGAIWPREILEFMRDSGYTASAGVIEGWAEGLLDRVDVRRMPGG